MVSLGYTPGALSLKHLDYIGCRLDLHRPCGRSQAGAVPQDPPTRAVHCPSMGDLAWSVRQLRCYVCHRIFAKGDAPGSRRDDCVGWPSCAESQLTSCDLVACWEDIRTPRLRLGEFSIILSAAGCSHTCTLPTRLGSCWAPTRNAPHYRAVHTLPILPSHFGHSRRPHHLARHLHGKQTLN